MNIKEAKNEIKNTVQIYLEKEKTGEYAIPAIRQRPILLMGPPGIGKTQIMEQIARECKIALVSYTITHHTRQSAVGLPFIKKEEFGMKEYSVTEYTMSEIISSIYQKMRDTGLNEGILFIDEINCVSETLAPTMLQFLQCKKFGNQKIPDGWIIVAAGNPPEYNKSVREYDMVTLDRVRQLDITADYSVWKEYARKNYLHEAILSYLDIRPNNFYRIEADIDGLQFVTARGWEDLSSVLFAYQKNDIEITEEIVYEFLRHHDVAQDFIAYLEIYQKYQDDYNIEAILNGEVSPAIYQRICQSDFDERICVVHLIVDSALQIIRKEQWEKNITDLWYDFLKKYKKNIEKETDFTSCYIALYEQEETEIIQLEKLEQITKQERNLKQVLISKIKEYCPKNETDPKKCFQIAKSGFDKQRQILEQEKNRTKEILENIFDFMEAAFESNQEMVVLITQLAITSESACFLAQVPCERYIRYSRELLIGTKRQEILSELEEK